MQGQEQSLIAPVNLGSSIKGHGSFTVANVVMSMAAPFNLQCDFELVCAHLTLVQQRCKQYTQLQEARSSCTQNCISVFSQTCVWLQHVTSFDEPCSRSANLKTAVNDNQQQCMHMLIHINSIVCFSRGVLLPTSSILETLCDIAMELVSSSVREGKQAADNCNCCINVTLPVNV